MPDLHSRNWLRRPVRVARCAVLALAAGLFSASVSAHLARAQIEAPSPLVDALVTRVVDGSTLDAQVRGMRTPVGYLGVNVPALNQACGQEAFQRNLELTAGGVLLEADPLYSMDDHRRLLFYAFTPDGTSIEETLIREGLAHATRADAAHGPDLMAAEADAAANGQGCLWAN